MLALLFGAAELRAQVERPLLVEGTNTVLQRVLTRPGVSRRDGPGGDVIGHYPAFQPLYVFAREGTWIRVGGAANLPPEGWVSEETVIAWRHNIVAAFANLQDGNASSSSRTSNRWNVSSTTSAPSPWPGTGERSSRRAVSRRTRV